MTTLVEEANRTEEPGTHVMAVLDKSGDTRIIWDPANPEEVASAKRTFDELRGKGYSAFSVKKNGDKDKAVRTFDSAEEKLILAPALVGG
jgi:hypothetical protein